MKIKHENQSKHENYRNELTCLDYLFLYLNVVENVVEKFL